MVKAIATTKFQDGGLPILSGDCYMHRQANFYNGLWPEGTDVAEDGDIWFFYLPSPEGGPKYMLTAGDIYAAGTDKPETYGRPPLHRVGRLLGWPSPTAASSRRRTRTSTSRRSPTRT